MPKFARIYYFEGERVEGQMPDTKFIGDIFTKRENPSDPRMYLFLRRSGGKDTNGEWVDIKATKITWSDGTSTDISDRVITVKRIEATEGKSAGPAPSTSGSSGSTSVDKNEFLDDLG